MHCLILTEIFYEMLKNINTLYAHYHNNTQKSTMYEKLPKKTIMYCATAYKIKLRAQTKYWKLKHDIRSNKIYRLL